MITNQTSSVDILMCCSFHIAKIYTFNIAGHNNSQYIFHFLFQPLTVLTIKRLTKGSQRAQKEQSNDKKKAASF